MSTPGSVDPESLAATKNEIRGLVAEIAQLSKSDIAPQEFYNAMLTRVVSALAGVGGAVWVLNEDRQLELEFQIGLHKTELATSQENQQQHGQLLGRALTSDEGMLVAPHSGGTGAEGGNPTEFLLVLGALATENQRYGIVEIFQRPGTTSTTQRGYLRFLLQICELASSYLKSRELRQFADRETLWSQLEQFSRAAHDSLDPRETAYILANEGRRLIDCDRVSVAIRKGRRCRIEAVSGQDTFERRASNVVQLGELASLAVSTGDEIWYTGDTTDMAPQVEEAIHEYADQSHTKAMGILPLWRPENEADSQDESDVPSSEPMGALIIEQINHSHVSEGLRQRVEMVRNHGAVAMANSLQYDGLFLMPVWRAIGNNRWVVEAKTLPKTLTISAAVLLVLIAIFIVPADFELSADGTLQPSEQREVFVPESGDVSAVHVDHGTPVKAGQELVVLENSELAVQIRDLQGERASAVKEKAVIMRRLQQGSNLDPSEENQLARRRMQLDEELKSLAEQIEVQKKRQENLTVRSPIAGQVVTWDVRGQLTNRPVERGQVLMTVADPNSSWELEILMPDADMGHVLRERDERRQQVEAGELDEEDRDVPVTYILATDPGTSFTGRIIEIQSSAEVHNESGNTVLIRVKMEDPQPDERQLRPGATVTAKVYCGRSSIGYVWFHDLIDFVRTNVLFRL